MAITDTPDTPSVPLEAPLCPLCGQANRCAVARSGSFDTPCWCRDAQFSADLLARVPAAQRGRACLCARCADTESPPP